MNLRTQNKIKESMTNAKKEFLDKTEGRELVCAKVGTESDHGEYDWHILKENYTKEDYDKFLDALDFSYHSGYGRQELYGIILFKDSYSDRGEYDGSEWWQNHKSPTADEVYRYKPF